MLPYVQGVLIKDGARGLACRGVTEVGLPPLVFNKVKEENLGTVFLCFSLPKRGCGEVVGTMES